jgi:Ethylbenzene dehydrogenase
MPGVTDDKKTKYVAGASLAEGKFFDLFQYRSGTGQKIDGHIADKRVIEGGTALSEARGELNGDTWTVNFTRKLSGGEGDVALQPGKEYNFGFAIHDDHTAGRYHYVSFGYTLALDNPQAGVNAMKQ